MDRMTLHDRADGYVENPTDADYAAAARWALQQKNLPLAVQQVSAALALNPLHEPHLRLLDDIVARGRGPLLLVELPEKGAFFGICAAFARRAPGCWRGSGASMKRSGTCSRRPPSARAHRSRPGPAPGWMRRGARGA